MAHLVDAGEVREAAAVPGTVIRRAVGHHAALLRRPVELLRVTDPAGVAPALRRVDQAARDGLHAFGAVAYQAATALDPTLTVRGGWSGPLLWFGLYERLEPATLPAPPEPPLELGPWTATVSEAEHAAAVARVREHIAAGETYQVNLTHRLRTRFDGDPLALAAQLWGAQPTAHGAYLHLGDRILLSASPEIFFQRDATGRVTMAPMKGTRPRGRTAAEDEALRAALLASEKDRAENLMIVDMARNDLGRVAAVGSVSVAELFGLMPLPTAWQMISTVRASCHADLAEMLAALFPCASITGAPKVRTMHLIAALETTPRGFYTGAVGGLDPGGAADFAVAIRTLELELGSGRLEYGVGGGIVWDSVARDEWAECATKALVLDRPGDVRLLETLLWEPRGGWLLLPDHLDRLRDSAARLGYALVESEVRRSLHEAVAGADGALRVRLTLQPTGRIAVTTSPLPAARPWRVGLADQSVDSSDRRLYLKTTDRRLYDRARAARPECDDVLLRNERGELTEATLANLVLRLEGEWLTPPVECGLLPGIYRAALLRAGRLRERVLTLDDLARAEGLYLINSVRRWIEVEWRPGAGDPAWAQPRRNGTSSSTITS